MSSVAEVLPLKLPMRHMAHWRQFYSLEVILRVFFIARIFLVIL